MTTRKQGKPRRPPHYHMVRPGSKAQGTGPEPPDHLGRRLSVCGHRYGPDKFVNRDHFAAIVETVRQELRLEQAGGPAQAHRPPGLCVVCRSGLKKLMRKPPCPAQSTRPWTEEEKDLVRRGYQHNRQSIVHLALKLDRTEHAVKGVIQQLGITRSNGRKPWTRKQDQQLIDLAGTVSMNRIAQIMGRSANSVIVRAKRLGINRRDRTGWYTAREASHILGVDDHWVRTRLQTGALAGTRYTAEGEEARLDVHDPSLSGHTWRIEEKELVVFIRKYAHELTGRNVDLLQIVDLLACITEEERQRGRPPAPIKSRKAIREQKEAASQPRRRGRQPAAAGAAL